MNVILSIRRSHCNWLSSKHQMFLFASVRVREQHMLVVTCDVVCLVMTAISQRAMLFQCKNSVAHTRTVARVSCCTSSGGQKGTKAQQDPAFYILLCLWFNLLQFCTTTKSSACRTNRCVEVAFPEMLDVY